MFLLYDLGIRLYYVGIRMASLWNEKARKWLRGRKNWQSALEKVFEANDRVVWFHCASLGEFEQGRPVIEKVKEEHPEFKILLTFFSPSGYEKRRNFPAADHVCYLPLDTAGNARRFLSSVPVEKAIFIKYEFWYHFLKEVRQRNIELYLASGIFRKQQLFFRWYGKSYRKVLEFYTMIFVQNLDSESLLRESGIRQVEIAGDTRFDRVAAISASSSAGNMPEFKDKLPVIVAGSTWEKDEQLIREVYNHTRGRYNWIIAPHEPSEQNLRRLRNWFPGYRLFSEIREKGGESSDLVLVDTIGHLSSLYRYGDLAYIGGGFGRGIHNTLEAAGAGLPVFFGPNFKRFREAVELQSEGAAHVVQQVSDLEEGITLLTADEKALAAESQIAEDYVIKNKGATQKIVDFVFKTKAH